MPSVSEYPPGAGAGCETCVVVKISDRISKVLSLAGAGAGAGAGAEEDAAADDAAGATTGENVMSRLPDLGLSCVGGADKRERNEQEAVGIGRETHKAIRQHIGQRVHRLPAKPVPARLLVTHCWSNSEPCGGLGVTTLTTSDGSQRINRALHMRA